MTFTVAASPVVLNLVDGQQIRLAGTGLVDNFVGFPGFDSFSVLNVGTGATSQTLGPVQSQGGSLRIGTGVAYEISFISVNARVPKNTQNTPVATAVAAGIWGGYHLASGRGGITNNISNGTDVMTPARVRATCPLGTMNPRFIFENVVCNTAGSEIVQTTPVTYSYSIEYPQGVINQVTVNGATSWTVAAGAAVITDPVALDLPAGAVFWHRTAVQQSGGTFWPNQYLTVSISTNTGQDGDGYGGRITAATLANPCVVTMAGHQLPAAGGTITVKNAAGLTQLNGTWTATYIDANNFSVPLNAVGLTALSGQAALLGTDLSKPGSGLLLTSGGVLVPGPTAMLGEWPDGVRQAAIGQLGDSVDTGSGDNSTWGKGFLHTALGTDLALTIPIVSLSVQGTRASQFADTANIASQSLRRRKYLSLPYIHVGFGINDILNGRTSAQLKADNLAIGTLIQKRGSRAILRTLTPNTTSTNAWADTNNQTLTAFEAPRVDYNNWVRAGAPVDPTTKAAVAIGTSSALLAGDVGHPYWKTYDPWANCEVGNTGLPTVNGGKWIVSAGQPTTDGTHPSTAVVAIAAATTKSVLLPYIVGY